MESVQTEFIPVLPPDLTDFNGLLEETLERKKIAEFSWDVGIKLFERVMGSKRKSEMYFLNGKRIDDQVYLEEVTREICREYGLSFLDIMADLILPVGYGYSNLVSALPSLLADAFKPISKVGEYKTVVWIEDEFWKDSSTSIIETFVCQSLLCKIEPVLLAPMKYFDKEVFAAILKSFQFFNQDTNNTTASCSISNLASSENELDSSWKTLSLLIKMGFLLAIRASNVSSLIVLHFSQKMAEKINAFELLDLAEAEGHKIKCLKNFKEFSPAERLSVVNIFLEKLKHDIKPQIDKVTRVGAGLQMGNVNEILSLNGAETCRGEDEEENMNLQDDYMSDLAGLDLTTWEPVFD